MSDHSRQTRTTSMLSNEPQLVTRFSIVLMAFTLMGMGIGSALPPTFGALTLGTGFVGILAYAAVELVASRKKRETVSTIRSKSEDRLVRHLKSSATDIPTMADVSQE